MAISGQSLKNLIYKTQSRFFRFVGDIKWSGWKRPFWFTINAQNYLLKGHHYREVEKTIQPGDILIRRFEGYVDKWFIPGYYNHAGICMVDNKVVHAISEGVIEEDLIDFMRTDHLVVLRLKEEIAESDFFIVDDILRKAHSLIGRPYDFAFDFADTNRFSCTEVVAYCYADFIIGKKRFGQYSVVADDIVAHSQEKPKLLNTLKIIWNSNEKKNTQL